MREFLRYSHMVLIVLAMALAAEFAVAQQPDPDSPRWKGVVALRDFLSSSGDEALPHFVHTKVSAVLRDRHGVESLSDSLERLRTEYAGSEMAGARPEGELAAALQFSGGRSISFELEPASPDRFVRIGALRGPSDSTDRDVVRPSGQDVVTTLAELREKLAADADAERFSGVVLIAKDGKTIFHEAFGYADYVKKERNKLDTRFNLGSINKLFTMAAVYQLLKAGTIDLDDPIGKYLPQFPEPVRSTVTIRHLLDHRSGWGAYWENPTWKAHRHKLRTLAGYMAFIKDIPLDFEPGTRKQYSNTGYEVLGAIVEKASGQSYDDYMSKNLYEPVGMKSTELLDHDLSTPNVAIGYTDGGYGANNLSWLPVKGTAAGGGFSTAGDLLRFARAIDDSALLPSKFSGRVRGGGFAGGAPGVSTMLGLNVAGDHIVIVLSNFDPPAAMSVGREITEMLRRNNPGVAGATKYRIGIGLAPGDDGPSVNYLVPGAPGEREGLHIDDVLLALNGTSLNDDPIAVIDAALTKPDPIVLRVRRGQTELIITITPELIN